MKLAGLMCWHFDAAKSLKHADPLAQLCEICDEVFVLDDGGTPINHSEFRRKYPKIQSIIRCDERDHHWNDWSNHCTLMLAAAKHGCEFVFWLDDDESVYPKADRALFEPVLKTMQSNPMSVATNFHWWHVWEDVHFVRQDGDFKTRTKPFVQRNPFYRPGCICFANGPDTRLHSWPMQGGTILHDDSIKILHYALLTQQDRDSAVAKYKLHDPEGKYRNYMLEEMVKPPTLMKI